MTMKIDYDELRKKAEDARAWVSGASNISGDSWRYYIEAVQPDVTLRLLKIIGKAKQRLRNISNIDGFDDHNGAFLEAVVALDEIAKLENGE